MAVGGRKGHTRRTASGGTTTVRPHSFRYKAASNAASLWDRPGGRRKALGWLAAGGIASLAYGVVWLIWGVGEGIVVAAFTFVAVAVADNATQARRAWRNRRRWRSLSHRLNHTRARFYRRRTQYLDSNPFARHVFEKHVRRYQVNGALKGPDGKTRATTSKTVRGKRKAKALVAKGKAAGWETETLTVLDPMERARS